MVGNTKMCCCFCNYVSDKNLEEFFVTFEEGTGNRNMFL